jgi:S1-C subfamily serine protease
VQAAPSLPIQPANESLEMPGFLVFIDAAPGGPSVRAEFVSQATPQPHPAWDVPLLALGGLANPRPGALVFTLAGRFVGMVLASDDETLVAPGEALIARADRLTRGESILAANAGLTVQPLSSALTKATKADHGVIIAAINNGGSSAGPLRVGDVIQMIDRDEIRSVGDWERVLSHRAPGTTVTLQIARREGTTQVPLTLMWRDAPLAFGSSANGDRATSPAKAGNTVRSGAAAFGLGLRATATRNAAGTLEVVRVDANGAAARAELHVGDLLVALPSTPAPLTLARVDAACNALAAGDALLLSISRAGQPLVVAIEKP